MNPNSKVTSYLLHGPLPDVPETTSSWAFTRASCLKGSSRGKPRNFFHCLAGEIALLKPNFNFRFNTNHKVISQSEALRDPELLLIGNRHAARGDCALGQGCSCSGGRSNMVPFTNNLLLGHSLVELISPKLLACHEMAVPDELRTQWLYFPLSVYMNVEHP